jgi:hypothetical protein
MNRETDAIHSDAGQTLRHFGCPCGHRASGGGSYSQVFTRFLATPDYVRINGAFKWEHEGFTPIENAIFPSKWHRRVLINAPREFGVLARNLIS